LDNKNTITTKMDEYNKTEEEINNLIITVYSAVLICAYGDFSTPPVTCRPSIFDQQLDCTNFVDRHSSQHYHLPWCCWL
jgi:hypothetical protein